MSRTTILPNDPNKRKAWAAAVANDAAQEQYFARLVGEEGSRSAVIKKTELEKGAGDEVTPHWWPRFVAHPSPRARSSRARSSRCSTTHTRCASTSSATV